MLTQLGSLGCQSRLYWLTEVVHVALGRLEVDGVGHKSCRAVPMM